MRTLLDINSRSKFVAVVRAAKSCTDVVVDGGNSGSEKSIVNFDDGGEELSSSSGGVP